ncbi:MAG: hypothetical protein PQJ60_08515 [Spirochaetales bacterium]|nr:hypothetical protein [Spirochaetales bacterium]
MILELNYNDTWEDVSDSISQDSVIRNLKLHSDLSPTINTLKFKIIKNNDLIQSVMAANTVYVRAWEDEDMTIPYFYGTLEADFSVKVASRVEGMSCEAVDLAWMFKTELDSSLGYDGYYLMNGEEPEKSLVHLLLGETEFPVDLISDQSFDMTIDYFYVDDGETVEDTLTQLLGEFGYLYNVEIDGTFKLYPFVPVVISSDNVLDNSNMLGTLEIEKNESAASSVTVNYRSICHETDRLVATDTTDGTDTYSCNIDIEADGCYPEDSEDDDVYMEYSYNDYDLIRVENASLEWDGQSDLSVLKFEADDLEAIVCIKNDNGANTRTLYQLDIRGDVYYYSDYNSEYVSNGTYTDEEEEFDAYYIQDSSEAASLAQKRANYWKYAQFNYSAESRSQYSIGSFVTLEDSTLGISTVCQIIEIKDKPKNKGLYAYTLVGAGEYELLEDTSSRKVLTWSTTQETTPPYYTWIKYSSQEDGTGMTDSPTDTTLYIGIAANQTSSTESDNPTDYTWSRYVGDGGYSVQLTLPTYTFPASSEGYVDKTVITTQVQALKGDDVVEIVVSRLTAPEGMEIVQTGTTLEITVEGSLLADSGSLTIPVQIWVPVSGTVFGRGSSVYGRDGQIYGRTINSEEATAFELTFTWAKAIQGATGESGADGSDGIDFTASSYLGKYNGSHPDEYNAGNFWLVYDTDDNPIQRGIWAYDGTELSRFADNSGTNSPYVSLCLSDILWAVNNEFGSVSDYGDIDFVNNLVSSNGFITRLGAQILTISEGGKITTEDYEEGGETGFQLDGSTGQIKANSAVLNQAEVSGVISASSLFIPWAGSNGEDQGTKIYATHESVSAGYKSIKEVAVSAGAVLFITYSGDSVSGSATVLIDSLESGRTYYSDDHLTLTGTTSPVILEDDFALRVSVGEVADVEIRALYIL